ncbi:hypothetical protein WOLCODRAFT_134808 [Wolfiporia cocos MD-104 SS10]|uniref:Geranylgeranyl pyrophosphate synthetase n=1 Tax=Wolfiporia cocos (strain MD-104) TaxID=742152 RepID=A0A2H3JSN9_WOLCO|nr:hypothetical protein WOLCODRAFT_134808 [Wolfiporia cocos MD-104 SS10]
MSGLRQHSGPIRTFVKPEEVDGPDVVITDLKYIGSYNWTNNETPTMIVSGLPPIWRERPLPFSVPPDPSSMFIEPDAHWLLMTPLYTLLRAVGVVAEMNADPLDWRSVDLVTDRNCLRNLLRWCGGSGRKPRDFRIDLQLACQHTILFSRFVTNYRHGAGAGNLSGMNLVVRFEVDACLASPAQSSTGVDDLASTMSDLSISSDVHSDAIRGTGVNRGSSPNEPRIIRAGTQVPDDAIVELATRSETSPKPFDWANSYPQLFFSQTPHHFLAMHSAGHISQFIKHHIDDPDLREVKQRAQRGFKKLKRLLEDIQDIVIEKGKSSRLSLVYRQGTLALYERASQGSCLPAHMLKQFD